MPIKVLEIHINDKVNFDNSIIEFLKSAGNHLNALV